MGSRSYTCPRCGKSVKSTSALTKHVNACKITVTLPRCQPSTPTPILQYNRTNHLDLLSDYFKDDISSGASSNNKEEIRPVDTMGNDDENSRLADIDE